MYVPAERPRAEVPALQEQPFEARRMADPLIARYPAVGDPEGRLGEVTTGHLPRCTLGTPSC
ncbi:hypothetical protein Pd630_LPD13090 (plasmid) [Rhodococcus opacus PD630]|nr:hypothetical protein Pd630_LPD13090 [Rhodococcus opacus PD630]